MSHQLLLDAGHTSAPNIFRELPKLQVIMKIPHTFLQQLLGSCQQFDYLKCLQWSIPFSVMGEIKWHFSGTCYFLKCCCYSLHCRQVSPQGNKYTRQNLAQGFLKLFITETEVGSKPHWRKSLDGKNQWVCKPKRRQRTQKPLEYQRNRKNVQG